MREMDYLPVPLSILPPSSQVTQLLKKKKQKDYKGLSVLIGEKYGPVMADLSELGHFLLIGWAGSKKEGILDSMIQSIMFQFTTNDVRLVLFDDKADLALYSKFNPYLLTEVIHEPDKCISALKWTLAEVQNRYKLFRENKVRMFTQFNEIAKEKIPHIVFVIKTMDCVMDFAPGEVSQMLTNIVSRGADVGIHFILVAERLSKNVIPAEVASNIPNRIICQLTSENESLAAGISGANLLKDSEFFFVKLGEKPQKINFVNSLSKNIQPIMEYFQKNTPNVTYSEVTENYSKSLGYGDEEDPLLLQALDLIKPLDYASASLLQRKFMVGFARAARMLDQLEAMGYIGPAIGSKPREVLKNKK